MASGGEQQSYILRFGQDGEPMYYSADGKLLDPQPAFARRLTTPPSAPRTAKMPQNFATAPGTGIGTTGGSDSDAMLWSIVIAFVAVFIVGAWLRRRHLLRRKDGNFSSAASSTPGGASSHFFSSSGSSGQPYSSSSSSASSFSLAAPSSGSALSASGSVSSSLSATGSSPRTANPSIVITPLGQGRFASAAERLLRGESLADVARLFPSVENLQGPLQFKYTTHDKRMSRREGTTVAHLLAALGRAHDLEELSLQAVTTPDSHGSTPLHYAAVAGSPWAIEGLLGRKGQRRGLKINAANSEGLIPLHLACRFDQPDCIQILLDNGADPGLETPGGWTSVHFAASAGCRQVLRLLLSSPSARSDKRSRQGWTPLHLACQNGHTECARLLLEHGADPDATLVNGITPLHYSASRGHVGTSRLLLESGASVDARGMDNMTPLHLAVEHGDADTISLLLAHGTDLRLRTGLSEDTIIHVAARRGNVLCLERIYRLYSDPQHQDRNTWPVNKRGFTPLHSAVMGGMEETLRFLLSRRPAAIDQRDARDGLTPLHLACLEHQRSCAAALVRAGASHDFDDAAQRLAGDLVVPAQEELAKVLRALTSVPSMQNRLWALLTKRPLRLWHRIVSVFQRKFWQPARRRHNNNNNNNNNSSNSNNNNNQQQQTRRDPGSLQNQQQQNQSQQNQAGSPQRSASMPTASSTTTSRASRPPRAPQHQNQNQSQSQQHSPSFSPSGPGSTHPPPLSLSAQQPLSPQQRHQQQVGQLQQRLQSRQLPTMQLRSGSFEWKIETDNVHEVMRSEDLDFLRAKVLDQAQEIDELRRKLSIYVNDNDSIQSLLSNEFICPISQEVMMDPVCASDGFSYERKEIEAWIESALSKTDGPKSPMTREALDDALYPNHALRAAIKSFLDKASESLL